MKIDVTTIMASRGKRLGGSLLDALFGIIIMVPIMLFTGYFEQSFSGVQPSFIQQLGYFVVGWLVFLALHGYLLDTKGQTIGKLIVNTRIVDHNGNIPNFGNLIVLRYLIIALLAFIPIIGALFPVVNVLLIFRKDRRCLHDHLAGTWVVDNQLLNTQNALRRISTGAT